MSIDIDLKRGQVINNDQLCEIFKCSPQAGMRRSLKTNSLVLVSNHVASIYDDRWIIHARTRVLGPVGAVAFMVVQVQVDRKYMVMQISMQN